MSTATIRPAGVPKTLRQQREARARTAVASVKQSLRQQNPPHDLIEPHFLQVSPYSEQEHLLDISSIETPSRLFAQALTTLEPATPAYATTPYAEAFKWPSVFATLRSLARVESYTFPRTEFYVVEFRSQLKEELDRERLYALDKHSHREATAAGYLLKYWFGSPDANRRNLATCLWRGKEDAIEGGKGLWHSQARTIISTTYDAIDVSGLRLVVEEGAEDWRFEPWIFH